MVRLQHPVAVTPPGGLLPSDTTDTVTPSQHTAKRLRPATQAASAPTPGGRVAISRHLHEDSTREGRDGGNDTLVDIENLASVRRLAADKQRKRADRIERGREAVDFAARDLIAADPVQGRPGAKDIHAHEQSARTAIAAMWEMSGRGITAAAGAVYATFAAAQSGLTALRDGWVRRDNLLVTEMLEAIDPFRAKAGCGCCGVETHWYAERNPDTSELTALHHDYAQRADGLPKRPFLPWPPNNGKCISGVRVRVTDPLLQVLETSRARKHCELQLREEWHHSFNILFQGERNLDTPALDLLLKHVSDEVDWRERSTIVCSQCYDGIFNNRVKPAMSISNDNDLGNAPASLPPLTAAEQQCFAFGYVHQQLIRIVCLPSQSSSSSKITFKVKGHSTIFGRDSPTALLPNLCKRPTGPDGSPREVHAMPRVFIAYVGTKDSYDKLCKANGGDSSIFKSILSQYFEINVPKVKLWFAWFQAANPLFRDLPPIDEKHLTYLSSGKYVDDVAADMEVVDDPKTVRAGWKEQVDVANARGNPELSINTGERVCVLYHHRVHVCTRVSTHFSSTCTVQVQVGLQRLLQLFHPLQL